MLAILGFTSLFRAPSIMATDESPANVNGHVSHEEISVEAPFDMPLIKVPVFPNRDFVITEFGADQDSQVEVTEVLKKAIAACHQAGGGRVVVPAGTWTTGAVHLKSNVNLHLAEGAELLFSDNPDDYLPAVLSSWEGMECYNYSPLIYALECKNIALTGKGTIRAKMGTWKSWFGRPAPHMNALKELYHMASKDVPVEERQMAVGQNHLRPQLIQFNRCEHVLIEDVKIRNSPFWTVHLLLSKDIVVRRIDVVAHGHNNDGIDPEFVQNLLVENCRFDQGDDAIAIKAGRNQDAWRLNTATENIVIRNCTMVRGHQLVAIGSELSGGVRNVYLHDCDFTNNKKYKPFNIVFIKTNHRRGGFVENIYVENISAEATRDGVLGIDTDVLYQWRDLVPTYEERLTPIRNIRVSNVTVEETSTPFKIQGDERLPIKEIYLENITINKVYGQADCYEHVESIHENGVEILELVSQ